MWQVIEGDITIFCDHGHWLSCIDRHDQIANVRGIEHEGVSLLSGGTRLDGIGIDHLQLGTNPRFHRVEVKAERHMGNLPRGGLPLNHRVCCCRVRLAGVRLVGARLEGVRLVGARLEEVRLVGARLAGARLEEARLVGIRLVGARLAGIRLVGARLVGIRLVGIRLVGEGEQ
ncbi:MAG: pentapeptide repeat-containing protein [Alphaproteobacteria bacterium]|nr:pentapeptide repeat-containing protein [Alphaproteobacteria bacterium]